VEVVAHSLGEVPEAEALIEAFMREHELTSENAPLGKLLTIIKALRPHHWQT
jgi:hypothetical protein